MTDRFNDDRVVLNKDENRDPITGEPGSHPVGTGIGAAGGAYAGAMIGAAAGPVGIVAGTIIGGLAGGLAGSGIGELVNPTDEEAFWSQNYSKRPYVAQNETFDTYKPAYRYGYEAKVSYPDRTFDEVKTDLQTKWDKTGANSSLEWNKAEPAIRDAYVRTGDVYTQKASAKSGMNAGTTATAATTTSAGTGPASLDPAKNKNNAA